MTVNANMQKEYKLDEKYRALSASPRSHRRTGGLTMLTQRRKRLAAELKAKMNAFRDTCGSTGWPRR